MQRYNRENRVGMSGSRKRKQLDGDTVVLREKINIRALEQVAGCHAAGVWQPNGSGPTLRKIIADMLAQVSEGSLTTVWREEDRMQRLALTGRRYSGYAEQAGDIPSFEHLVAKGVNKSSVGRSTFGLPGWLRDLARCGLRDCFIIDMVNAHPSIQHKRHPHLNAIAQYVQNRNQILNSLAYPRDAAKNLFIRLVYDGGLSTRTHTRQVQDGPSRGHVAVVRLINS